MFQTKACYPICAIIKAIELDHSIIWYALEDNAIYKIKFENDIDDSDDSVWYYGYESRKDWMTWKCDDLIKRYKDCYPASDYRKWFDKQKR